MKITYLNHSGFLVETESCYLIFDYWRYGLPVLNHQKPVIVFASHSHPDHYNPDIYVLLHDQGFPPSNVIGILGKDIKEQKYPDPQLASQYIKARRYEEYSFFHTSIHTLQSTDAGVAYYVETPEGSIYHAGDLNDWIRDGSFLSAKGSHKNELSSEEKNRLNKQMTGNYRHEINLLKDLSKGHIDVAFQPLDPLQGKPEYSYSGMLYLLEQLSIDRVYPMHYWSLPQIISDFCSAYPQYRSIIQNTEAARDFN